MAYAKKKSPENNYSRKQQLLFGTKEPNLTLGNGSGLGPALCKL